MVIQNFKKKHKLKKMHSIIVDLCLYRHHVPVELRFFVAYFRFLTNEHFDNFVLYELLIKHKIKSRENSHLINHIRAHGIKKRGPLDTKMKNYLRNNYCYDTVLSSKTSDGVHIFSFEHSNQGLHFS